MERMESGYLCEVLHYLLQKRLGVPLVKTTVDLVDKDNEASLDLMCALFKHLKNIDDANLNEALRSEIGKLCKDLIHLLEWGTEVEKTSLVEKCCILYNIILNIKFTGVTEMVLCTSDLLKEIRHKYKDSAVVQEKTFDISLKCFESLESLRNVQPPEKSQRTGVLGKRRSSDAASGKRKRSLRGEGQVELATATSGTSTQSLSWEEQAVAETETMSSKPQIKDLMDALFHEVADKWKIIGVLLDISKGKLASIAENYHDPQKCLLAMLETWLERVHPPPTWAAIIEAVEFLGEEQLGKTLRDTYTQ